MENLLHIAYDAEDFRSRAHQLVDQLADYISECRDGKPMPVLPPAEPEELYSHWLQDFNHEGFDFQQFCQTIINQSIHIHHPRYVGHQVAPPAPMAALTELMSALLNNGMAIYEMGPAATAIERVVVEWLAKHVGLGDRSGGVLTSGGSAGNLTGLLAARQTICSHNVWDEGALEGQQLAVMVSEEAHYSVARAARIMGWGAKGVIKIPVNQELQADDDQLENCLAEARAQGLQVIAIVGNACSTSTGSYDDLHSMSEFARKHNIWFHVDGAHGGAAVFSGKYQHLVKGMELADSVVIDFHKMMLTPALTTAVLFKDVAHSFETFAQKAEYLLSNGTQKPWFDGAARTLECTKKMMSIKIYALIKQYGKELFSEFVTQLYDLGQAFADMIRNEPGFELAIEPQSNIVCFRYWPNTLNMPINYFTAQIRSQLLRDERFYVVQTYVRGDTYLRTTLMNPFTSTNDLSELLHLIKQIADEIIADK
ncbi:MAG: aminotransferase class I/II-fold pyridoxal phosphate-dependent enzyme [Bacteroidales bacterium]|nr:aminotransferase class I/II-fold pyridoxal phosphate-dependent enzyme [Bacteroidales bacterium]